MKDLNQEERYQRARDRVYELKKFYGNLTSYIFVVILLASINYFTNGFSYPWFLWVAGFWGLGLAFHALRVLGGNFFFGRDWEERKIKQFMEEEERSGRNRGWE
ncbi:2TM domain-containing protein [Robertkochia marina]|uniref:2TM domain-containing protein n=1 Tax=Robertkochia marina TaxID=1227945 RepID=A0A4V6RRS1_9FLAO|nr:2TM domain-containing protein [Robertkochia marina]THD65800.1 2TM domain-containing protein [Robertkochia marina]TRZ46513.1 histidine kinase [Robertkochia marina]